MPVPVHAAAIIGESMDENKARITVMAKDRRILQRHYTFIFALKSIRFRVAERLCYVKTFNFHSTTDAGLFSSPIFSKSDLTYATMKITTIALLLLLVGCGGTTRPQSPQPSTIFFGDSIFGAWNLDGYFLGKQYVNGGMFGYRTDQLKALLPDVLSGNKVCHGLDGNSTFPLTCVSVTPPKTIVIMAGWNNLFQDNFGNPADDLQSMAAMATAKGVKVIICTVYAYDPAHPAPWMLPTGDAPVTFYDMWRTPLNNNIGLIPGVTVVDFSGLFNGQSDYTVDGIHPNDSGYAQMRDLLTLWL